MSVRLSVVSTERRYIREVTGCLWVFCLLLCQEACEGDDIRIDLLLAHGRLVIAVVSHILIYHDSEVILNKM